jgi:Cdc6-like AAA superfamily ATPase
MPWQVTASDLIGREDELEEVAAFLDDPGRLGSALLLEGEPGIGKTMLWRRGVAGAKHRATRPGRAVVEEAPCRPAGVYLPGRHG